MSIGAISDTDAECGLQLWERDGLLVLLTCGYTWFPALAASLSATVLRSSRAGLSGASLGDLNCSQGGRHFLPGRPSTEASPGVDRDRSVVVAVKRPLWLSSSCRECLIPSAVVPFREDADTQEAQA